MMHKIPATWMRGGTSKGLFFLAQDLPVVREQRDALLLSALGSPDPYGKQINGVGGGTSSTSKIVIVSPSLRPDCDVDFLFGQVAIDRAQIDYSGTCGNLTTAVAPFAIAQGLVSAQEGLTTVRIWQANLGQRILAHVPTTGTGVMEAGSFHEAGVSAAGAEIRLEFLQPVTPLNGSLNGSLRGPSSFQTEALLPSGHLQDDLEVPDVGRLRVSYVQAGNPTIFMRAKALGLTGKELPDALNRDRKLLEKLENIRAHGAVQMGLAQSVEHAIQQRPATPKLVLIAPPASYISSAQEAIPREHMDLLARIVSMGKAHHAFTGTGAIALAVAAALPGTIVSEVARTLPGVATRIGHPSGVLPIEADVEQRTDGWWVKRVLLSRSARVLMQGVVHAVL